MLTRRQYLDNISFNQPPEAGVQIKLDRNIPLYRDIVAIPNIFQCSQSTEMYNIVNEQAAKIYSISSGSGINVRKQFYRDMGYALNNLGAGSNYYRANFGNVYNFKGQPITISVWFVLSSTSYKGDFMTCVRADNTANGLEFGVGTSGRPAFYRACNRAENSGVARLISDTTSTNLANPLHAYVPTVGAITHWTVTHTGGTATSDSKLYVNGVYEGEGRGTMLAFGPATELEYGDMYIGAGFGGTDTLSGNFHGYTGTMKIWKRVLSTDEILYEHRNPFRGYYTEYRRYFYVSSNPIAPASSLLSNNMIDGSPFAAGVI